MPVHGGAGRHFVADVLGEDPPDRQRWSSIILAKGKTTEMAIRASYISQAGKKKQAMVAAFGSLWMQLVFKRSPFRLKAQVQFRKK